MTETTELGQAISKKGYEVYGIKAFDRCGITIDELTPVGDVIKFLLEYYNRYHKIIEKAEKKDEEKKEKTVEFRTRVRYGKKVAKELNNAKKVKTRKRKSR